MQLFVTIPLVLTTGESLMHMLSLDGPSTDGEEIFKNLIYKDLIAHLL